MFENKKYLTLRTLEKMHASGIISKFSLATYSYGQHLGYVSNTVILEIEPEVIISVISKNGDIIEMKCEKKKKTYRIRQLFINKILIKTS